MARNGVIYILQNSNFRMKDLADFKVTSILEGSLPFKTMILFLLFPLTTFDQKLLNVLRTDAVLCELVAEITTLNKLVSIKL